MNRQFKKLFVLILSLVMITGSLSGLAQAAEAEESYEVQSVVEEANADSAEETLPEVTEEPAAEEPAQEPAAEEPAQEPAAEEPKAQAEVQEPAAEETPVVEEAAEETAEELPETEEVPAAEEPAETAAVETTEAAAFEEAPAIEEIVTDTCTDTEELYAEQPDVITEEIQEDFLPLEAAQDDAQELTLNQSATAAITTAGGTGYFKFTPEEAGTFKFYSDTDADTYGILYDEDMVQLAEDDQSGQDDNFALKYDMEGGRVYYFAVKYWDETRTGEIPVMVTDAYLYAYADEETGSTTTEVYVDFGEDLVLTVAVDAKYTDGLTYEWRSGNTWYASYTGNQLKLSSVEKAADYVCYVSDSYGNEAAATFQVKLSSDYLITPVGAEEGSNEITISAAPGSSVTLSVNVNADTTEGITFKWYDLGSLEPSIPIEGATDQEYTVDNLRYYEFLCCEAEDSSGNIGRAYFTVALDNELTACAYGVVDQTTTTVYAEPNGDITLWVEAQAKNTSNISYRWYKWDENQEFQFIQDEYSSSLMIIASKAYDCYRCVVNDGYGEFAEVTFYVQVENHFDAYVYEYESYETTVFMNSPETEVLKVSVTGDDLSGVTYQWKRSVIAEDEEGFSYTSTEDIENAVTDELKGSSITEDGTYYCYVSDGYGNTRTVTFNVVLSSNISELSLNEKTAVTGEFEKVTLFKYTPETSGQYRFASLDAEYPVTGYVYDADMNLLYNGYSENDNNFRITCDLAAGSTYYFGAKSETDIINNFQIILTDTYLKVYAADYMNYLTVSPGESCTMSVVVEGIDSDEVTFEWYLEDEYYNWTQIADAVTSELETGSMTQKQRYKCRVTDIYGFYREVVFTVAIDNGLSVTAAQKQYYTALHGDAELSVIATAEDTSQLSYQWQGLNEYGYFEDLDGETSDTLGLTDITEKTRYKCVVSDQYGNSVYDTIWVYTNSFNAYVTGSEFQVTETGIAAAPYASLDLEVTVTADDLSGVTYQWYKDRAELSGETDSKYTIESLQEAASYYCYVADAYGNTQSVYFYVNIENNLTVTTAQRYYYVPVHSSVELKVTATADDTGSLNYQWAKMDDQNNILLEGPDADTLILEDVTESAGYICTVTDGYDNTIRNPFWIYANSFKAYAEGTKTTSRPLEAKPGDSRDLKVIVEADDLSSVVYQWYADGSPIDGAVTDTYTTPKLEQSGCYYCIVTDDYGNRSMVYFWISVNHFEAYAAGTEKQTSTAIYLNIGDAATFEVAVNADDTSNMTYQWRSYGGDISGATEKTFVVNNVLGPSYYECKVSDGYGNSQKVYFNILVNNLQVQPEGGISDVYTDYNESATLKVDVTADDMEGITYRWLNYITGQSLNVTGDTLTIGHVQTAEQYFCSVNDKYGNYAEIIFDVHVNNGLTAYAADTKTETAYVTAGLNETAVLSVIAKADDETDLKYSWTSSSCYSFGDLLYSIIDDTTKASLEVPGTDEEIEYICTVTDRYKNTAQVHFFITGGDTDDEIAVEAISLNETEISLETEQTFTLKAEITPANAANQNVKWTSSDTKIATVDENGVVTAKTYGTAVITATAEDTANGTISAECTVNTLYYDVAGSPNKGDANYEYWYTPVYWAADSSITKGYGNVYFGPEENCTREQMITFLYREAGSPAVSGTIPFSDVAKGKYYYNAVLWAYNNGITKGYSSGPYKGMFGVGLTVTREDTVTFLYRMAGSPSYSTAKSFTDVAKGKYYYNAIMWAAQNGITNGYSSGVNKGKFGVGFNVLRKDIVTFIYRYHTKFGG